MSDSVRFQGGYQPSVECNSIDKPCGIIGDKPGTTNYAVDYLKYQGNLISSDFTNLVNGQNDLTTNIQTYSTQNADLLNTTKNPLSDYKSDYNYSVLNNASPKTTSDGINEDLDIMILRQNNFYIFGTLTMGTILIIAITIGSI
jgi:hypothetical protein